VWDEQLGKRGHAKPRTLIAALDAHRGHTSLLNTELEAFSKTDKGYRVAYVPMGIDE